MPKKLIGLIVACAFVAGRSAAPRATQTAADVLYEKDVVYITNAKVTLDIARPQAGGPSPLVVAIGGTGFKSDDRAAHEALIRALAARGYVAAAVGYRLGVRQQFPSPLQDVRAAVRFLRANAEKYAIDPTRVCAIGDSAGATLALLTALAPTFTEFDSGQNRELSSAVNCVVAVSGVTDFTRAYSTATDQAGYAQLLGGSAVNAPRVHAMASPVNWATPQAPPVMLMRAAGDKLVPAEQMTALADKLRAARTQVFTQTPPGSAHGIDLLNQAPAQSLAFMFLDQWLGKSAVAAQTTLMVADHGGRRQIVAMEWPSGRELWTVPNAGGHDVQPLPNGNVLFTMGPEKKIVEIDKDRKEIWTYGVEEGLQHPISAERLANGNTVIADAQAGKVIEIDKDRRVVWTYADVPELGNMRMRHVTRTAAGTTLIAVEAAGKIIEVNPAGEVIWTYQGVGGNVRKPYKAVRLPNGNTMMTLTDPGEYLEVNKAGTIVRSAGGEKPDLKMIWTSGFDRLPNGNVLVSDYLGHRIIELGPDNKVVHEVRMPTRTTASIAIVK